MAKPDTEQQELILAFVEEGIELLDNAEPLLIELETKSNKSGEVDVEVLNTIFRLFHSLKGGAGFLDLDTVGKVTHEAETLLDLFRKGKGTITSHHIDLLNQTCDFIRTLLGNIEASFTDTGFDDEAKAIIVDLNQTIQSVTNKPQEMPEKKTSKKKQKEQTLSDVDTAPAIDSEKFLLPEDAQNISESKEQLNDLKLTITPEMIKEFTTESEDLLAAAEDAFLNLEKQPNNEEIIGQAFRALHSFKGNAGFFGYSDLEKLSHQTETVLEKIRYGEITGESGIFSLLLDILDLLQDGVAKVGAGKEPTITSTEVLINLMQEELKKSDKSSGDKVVNNENASAQAKKSKKIGKDKSKKIDDSEMAKSKVAANQKKSPLKSEEARGKATPKSSATSSSKFQRQSIRVDVEKLDVLLDLVGELVIAEAMVTQNPDLRNLDVSLERFEKSSMHLNKITRDLQDISTLIRMIPLSGTFRRMIRLVRDLAQKSGKKVELEIIGEETAVDKTVVEQITDPLVHTIRNAVDHGIGTPQARKALGKPEGGHVTLEAKYAGSEVLISIKDDGMGLNRKRILAKAIERGFVQGDGADLPDEEVWQLIFQPGFSTANTVTDVSGRGVGMDVVRRNIESIRGQVDIRSETGKGTEVILRIPLTLAIIDGMVIRVGNNRYTIPIVAVRETIRLNAQDITKTMDGQEIINIRGNLLPVIRLHEFFKVEPDYSDLTKGIIMVGEVEGRSFCLFVDELIGQQQIVIKGLSDYIGNLRGISGCTILGEGDISLIIDVAGLTHLAESRSTQSAQYVDQYH